MNRGGRHCQEMSFPRVHFSASASTR
uniref:Uncharacterized protein n=1 Tax=Rhizophora mucronata TaxID=61149 RepID=A0A2P2PV93_RHIMU